MLKRRRKLSKDLQIRKKITTFAEDKRHLGKTIKLPMVNHKYFMLKDINLTIIW